MLHIAVYPKFFSQLWLVADLARRTITNVRVNNNNEGMVCTECWDYTFKY